MEGRPLLGTDPLSNCVVTLEMIDGGEVSVEPLD